MEERLYLREVRDETAVLTTGTYTCTSSGINRDDRGSLVGRRDYRKTWVGPKL